MINKEEIEKAEFRLKLFSRRSIVTPEGGKACIVSCEDIKTILQYISELESNNYEQNNIINNYIEIEKEHQELVGELIEENKKLKERLTQVETILSVKSIQELGMSDLYREG